MLVDKRLHACSGVSYNKIGWVCILTQLFVLNLIF